ncbi:MAG: DEAD/DEAH box helicase [Nitrospirae bacterium]|nr:MAG: DEAD/DEAH box helicase [Nitrospirota bacterium]
MPLSHFHPVIAEWFRTRFGEPTDVQVASWPAIRSRAHALIAAPTGSGKTLAAFLTCIDDLLQQALAGDLEETIYVLYVSPLKALSNDIQKNLQDPLAEITQLAISTGLLAPSIRVEVRTGDTPQTVRQQQLRRPPHILVTTPESLYLLLTARKSRVLLRHVRTIIVDEIHAVASTKRGSHLALSLERLDALCFRSPVRIGLSATQRPLEEIARFLVGGTATHGPEAKHGGHSANCHIVDIGQRRAMDLHVEVPRDELGAVATNAVWSDIYDRVAELARQHQSTLVFVNTRRLAERMAHHLAERLGDDQVASHHGSLSRKLRLSAEERLKRGETRVVVATASLELGIDIGHVDLVCQIGSPRAISTCIQRIGRAGHWIGAIPKGRLFCTTRDELVECAAVVQAMQAGDLDPVTIPVTPLDILAQQIVAEVAAQEWAIDELYALCTRAYPYRHLSRQQFEQVVHMLAEGYIPGRRRQQAHIVYDRHKGRIRARRGARLVALTSGGAIPDTAAYAVVAEPDGTVVGTVDEDFAMESLAGDIILLGTSSWRIRGVETGKMHVEDAHGAPPTIPFWRGEAPARTAELSAAVARLREQISRLLDQDVPDARSAARAWLIQACGLDDGGADQLIAYIATGKSQLGAVPTQDRIIAERFFDEGGGMQLVIHAPFGGRVNRAWGLALRKRFCTQFDFELQAAATDDGLVLSLREQHSVPLDAVFTFLHSRTVREVLMQAVLGSPLFLTRWRWTAARALALQRFQHGRKVPLHIQRMRAEDLLAATFPLATACQDNHVGDRPIPDHPLIQETMRDCLTEAMDIEGLIQILQGIEDGRIRTLAVESPAPSLFSHEILNANPYAFLDDAPLEERRARAVNLRRVLPDAGDRLGELDKAAIETVIDEAWPVVRDADELYDALSLLVWVPETEPKAIGWNEFFPSLVQSGLAVVIQIGQERKGMHRIRGWATVEHVPALKEVFPCLEIVSDSPVEWPTLPANQQQIKAHETGEAGVELIVRGWMEVCGPVTASELAAKLHLSVSRIQSALCRLEGEGLVLRGRFWPTAHMLTTPLQRVEEDTTQAQAREEEWCHRRLLARIHHRTVVSLRREIEPVSAAEFMRFLFRWQHRAPGTQLHGEAGLRQIVTQLSGFEAPASAWERSLFKERISDYKPELLDHLCLRGEVAWGRLTWPETALTPNLLLLGTSDQDSVAERSTPRRAVNPTSAAPLSFCLRQDLFWLLALARRGTRVTIETISQLLSDVAVDVLRHLKTYGASFFVDVKTGTGHLSSQIETALWELTAAGLVTADGFDNLRALLDPRRRRAEGKERARRPRHSAGRWALLPFPPAHQATSDHDPQQRTERWAKQLLVRYGIVFRDLIKREAISPPWHELLVVYRRMEWRGEIRGGRFVGGFTGEQFALPEAVEALRAVRRDPQLGAQEILLAPADPLNLVGILLPGERISPYTTTPLRFQNGTLVVERSPVQHARSHDRLTNTPAILLRLTPNEYPKHEPVHRP